MLSRRPNALLRLEALEDRVVPDGKVTAVLSQGRLVLTGDNQANGFVLERTTSGSTGAAGFRITPDATTSINDAAPGASVDLGDALTCVIDSRGGDDSIQINGVPGGQFARSLSVEGGTGFDSIKLQEVLVSSLSLTNSLSLSGSQGSDRFELQRVVVGGGSGGSALVRCLDGTCAVSISDSTFAVPFSVVSRGSLALASTHSLFSDVTVTTDGRASTLSSSVTVDDCTMGTLRVSTKGGSPQVSLSSSRFSNLFMKYEGSGTVEKTATTVIDRCTVDIEINSFSWGMSNSMRVSDSSSRKVIDKASPVLLRTNSSLSITGGHHGDVTVTSTGGFDLQLGQTSLSSLACTVVSPPSGSSSTSIADLDMDGVFRLTSQGAQTFSMTRSQAVDMFLKMDRLTSSNAACSVSITDSSLAGALSVDSRGTIGISLDACRSADFFLKLDGIKGESGRSSVSMTDCPIGDVVVRCRGTADVSSTGSSFTSFTADVTGTDSTQRSSLSLEDGSVSGSLSVTARSTGYDLKMAKKFAAVDMYLKLDRTWASAASSIVVLSDCTFSGKLSIESRGSLDFTSDACRSADYFLKLDGIKGESSKSSLLFDDSTMDDALIRSTTPAGITISGSSFSSFTNEVTGSDATQRASLTLEGSTVTNGLSITSRTTGYDLKMAKGCIVADVSLRLTKGSATAADNTFTLDDSSVTGRMSVQSFGNLDIDCTNAVCGDFFLKLDTVRGEKSASSLHMEHVIHRDLAVRSTCPIDISASSSEFDSVDCAIVTAPGTGQSPLVSRDRFDNVRVASAFRFSRSGASSDFSFGASTVGSFTCKFEAPTAGSNSIAVGDEDCDGIFSITTKGESHVSVSRCAAVDMFLKFERASTTQAVSSSSLEDVTLSGDLTVSSRGTHDVSVVRCETSHLFIKLDSATGDTGRSHVVLTSTDCDDGISVQSTTATDVTGEQLRSVDFYLKIESLRASPPISTISLTDSNFAGALTLMCAGGSDRMTLDTVTVLDRAFVSTGAGNDEFTLTACNLHGSSVFDGGAGSDTFTAALDCVFSSPPTVFGFETKTGL